MSGYYCYSCDAYHEKGFTDCKRYKEIVTPAIVKEIVKAVKDERLKKAEPFDWTEHAS